MNAFELKKVLALPPALRVRAFERFLRFQGMSRSQVAIVIHAIKKDLK